MELSRQLALLEPDLDAIFSDCRRKLRQALASITSTGRYERTQSAVLATFSEWATNFAGRPRLEWPLILLMDTFEEVLSVKRPAFTRSPNGRSSFGTMSVSRTSASRFSAGQSRSSKPAAPTSMSARLSNWATLGYGPERRISRRCFRDVIRTWYSRWPSRSGPIRWF